MYRVRKVEKCRDRFRMRCEIRYVEVPQTFKVEKCVDGGRLCFNTSKTVSCCRTKHYSGVQVELHESRKNTARHKTIDELLESSLLRKAPYFRWCTTYQKKIALSRLKRSVTWALNFYQPCKPWKLASAFPRKSVQWFELIQKLFAHP